MKHFIILILLLSGCYQLRKNEVNMAQPNMMEVRYGNDSILTMDIYQPATTTNNGRLILYIHGGGWYTGNKREATHWAKEFQSLGYTVVCMDYTLVDSNAESCYPRQMQDIDNAILFLQNNQLKYGLNLDKLVIMGASAGAQLALVYAYRYDERKIIKAAVSLCGILDLTDSILQNADLGDRTGLKM